jgi:hypothetical protein
MQNINGAKYANCGLKCFHTPSPCPRGAWVRKKCGPNGEGRVLDKGSLRHEFPYKTKRRCKTAQFKKEVSLGQGGYMIIGVNFKEIKTHPIEFIGAHYRSHALQVPGCSTAWAE